MDKTRPIPTLKESHERRFACRTYHLSDPVQTIWNISPEGKTNESVAFFKDLSLAGASLILFVLNGRHTDFGWHITSAFFNFK